MSNEPPFDSDRHALYVGWVIGLAMRNGLDVAPVIDDAGNYTDRFIIVLGDRTMMLPVTVTVVVPPPPDDWTLADE